MNKTKHPILIVTENLEVGGAEKYTVLVANELYRRGYRVIVLANEGPFRKHFHPGIRFVRAFFERGLLGVLYGAFQMVRVCLQEGVPLIHAQKFQSSQAAWLAKFITGVPVVKTAHGYTKPELLAFGKTIDKYSDRIVTVSKWLREGFREIGVSERKLRVIHNGMAPFGKRASASARRAFRASLGIGAGDAVLVTAVRLERGKKISSLIEWMVAIRQRIPHAKLVIVGDGPERGNLVRLAENLGLNGAVIFAGATTETSMFFQMADVYCTPTVARGMAVMEAMTAGLPVVGMAPISLPKVVVNGKCGYTVPRGDGAAFVNRTVRLLSNKPLAKEFGRAAKQRVLKHFSHTAMISSLEWVYGEVLENSAQ